MSRWRPYIFPCLFALLITLICGAQGTRFFGVILGLNLSSFILCGFDKLQAQREAMRVPEVVLWGLALLGGAGGLLFGMKIFRHKTRKASFQLVLLAVIVLQVWAIRYFGLVSYLSP